MANSVENVTGKMIYPIYKTVKDRPKQVDADPRVKRSWARFETYFKSFHNEIQDSFMPSNRAPLNIQKERERQKKREIERKRKIELCNWFFEKQSNKLKIEINNTTQWSKNFVNKENKIIHHDTFTLDMLVGKDPLQKVGCSYFNVKVLSDKEKDNNSDHFIGIVTKNGYL